MREFIVDEAEKRLIARFTQDVEPNLDLNKALYNSNDGYSRSREIRRVASIPLVIVEKWMNEDGINVYNKNHREAVRRKLNSNEYLWLRTAPGRV
jgi:hypothetical protein